MWNATNFVTALLPQVQRYKADNSWVRWWSGEDVFNAWRMYKTSSTASLGFLLLGDTKIRKDNSLLMNFGTATAHNIQEQQERELVAQLTKQRDALSRGGAMDNQYGAVKGPGSILSDDKWTPMLNDSFMLGGMHKGSEFHLAEDLFHAKTAHLQGMTAREKWNYFFNETPTTFWNNGVPRVFARECIGLKLAGYRPHFSEFALVFSGAGGMRLDFSQYLQGVTNAGLTGGSKAAAISEISTFLFNDPGALKI
jgi:hypothetical protein